MKVSIEVEPIRSEIKAVLFHFAESSTSTVKELLDDRLFAYFDSNKQMICIEMLAPCTLAELEAACLNEPNLEQRQRIKNLMHNTVPSQFVNCTTADFFFGGFF